jgi:hypothetical protein
MAHKAVEIQRDSEIHGPSNPLIWGVFTLTALQREERIRREAWLASQPEPEETLTAEDLAACEAASTEPDMCLADPWTPDLARVAIQWHQASGETQKAFAARHGFPVSRFRSKVAREVRASL